MNALVAALEDPGTGPARLRELLVAELRRGEDELGRKRSGYEDHVRVAFAPGVAALPVPKDFRADAAAIDDRAWRLVAAAVQALQTAAELPPPARPDELALRAGDVGGLLAIALGDGDGDPELAALAFDESVAGVDRLRAGAVTLDEIALHDPREPIGAAHTLKVAEAVARLGGDPSDTASVEQLAEPSGPRGRILQGRSQLAHTVRLGPRATTGRASGACGPSSCTSGTCGCRR